MTYCEEIGLKVGDKIKYIGGGSGVLSSIHHRFNIGDVLILLKDDGTSTPLFGYSEDTCPCPFSLVGRKWIKIEEESILKKDYVIGAGSWIAGEDIPDEDTHNEVLRIMRKAVGDSGEDGYGEYGDSKGENWDCLFVSIWCNEVCWRDSSYRVLGKQLTLNQVLSYFDDDDIDWDSAPEGTTHYNPDGGRCVWHNLSGGRWKYWSFSLVGWCESGALRDTNTSKFIPSPQYRLKQQKEESKMIKRDDIVNVEMTAEELLFLRALLGSSNGGSISLKTFGTLERTCNNLFNDVIYLEYNTDISGQVRDFNRKVEEFFTPEPTPEQQKIKELEETINKAQKELQEYKALTEGK